MPPRSWLVRRLVSHLALGAVALVLWGGLPLWGGLALIGDALRPRRLALTRTVAFFAAFTALELVGVAAAAGLWALGWVAPGRSAARHYALQRWWAARVGGALVALFGLRIQVEGAGDEGGAPVRGPLIVLPRHVSMADTFLPMLLLAVPHGLRPRYVLKRELLWDPCLDVVGSRLPNAFVRRGAPDGSAETARVAALAAGLGPEDMVVLYPEGTRFSRRRRAAILARLEADPVRHAAAAALRRVLPPRAGGFLALANSGTDVLLVAHTGLEGARRLGDLVAGALVGREVRVRLRRVPAAEVPVEPEARVAWLEAAWRWMDEAVVALEGSPG